MDEKQNLYFRFRHGEKNQVPKWESKPIRVVLLIPLIASFLTPIYGYEIPDIPFRKGLKEELKNPEIKLQELVQGFVKSESGKLLAGATIQIKGSTISVQTDDNGRFSIKAGSNAILIIKFVGFKSQEIPINGRKEISITLKEESKEIEEVVYTGYQQIKKEALTGSMTTIKAEDIKLSSMGTLDKMLQGQIAGVAIETTSATFGTAPKIRIRGNSSLSGVNEPLWVLDGVPLETPLNISPSELYSGAARNLLSSALSGVNPDDIDDITVLRDATATALYGTRAVNGVIVITTKRGRRETPLQINYNGTSTLSMKPSIKSFDILNSLEQTKLNEEIFTIYQNQLMNFSAQTTGAFSKLNYLRNTKTISDQEYRDKLQELKTVNTNWFDHLYNNSIMQQHSLSTSFGGNRAAVRASVSYYDDQGRTRGEKTNRYTINLNANYQFVKWFDTDFMVKYSSRSQKNSGVQVNPFNYARRASRNMTPYASNGDFEYYKRGYSDFNILKEIDNNNIDLDSKDFLAQIDLNFKIGSRLKIKTLLSTRTVSNNMNELQSEFSNYANQFRQMGIIAGETDGFYLSILDRNERLYKDPSLPLYMPAVSVLPVGGILDKETSKTLFYTGRFQLNYEPIRDINGHSLNLLGGFELSSNEQNGLFTRNYGYISANKTMTPNPLAYLRLALASNLPFDEERRYGGRNLLAGSNYYPTAYLRRTLGYYANLSYDYLRTYVLESTLRFDASNVTGQRYTPTYSFGVAWNLSNESFMKKLNESGKITNTKIRATYGLRGNDGARGSGMVGYHTNIPRVYPKYNASGVYIEEPENQSLQFEMEHTYTIGLNSTLFNKFDITFDIYRKNNFNLLARRDVALSLGYQDKTFNWANMQNDGVEFQLLFKDFAIDKDWKLGLMFNGAYNKNKLLSDVTGARNSIYQISHREGADIVGKPTKSLYSFRFAGLNEDGLTEYYNENGEKVAGFPRNIYDTNILEYQGTRQPVYSGGFTPTIKYKNFMLSASFIFNAGHVVRLQNFYANESISSLFRDDINVVSDFAYRWTVPGDEQWTNIPRLITELDIDNYNIKHGLFDSSIFGAYNASNIRTVKASYLRFRNLNIQYDLGSVTKRLPFKNLVVSLEASNIALWASKRLKGQDPEILLSGINIPPVKTYTFSLNFSL